MEFSIKSSCKKIAAAFAAGCTAIVKGPEETPASVAELIKAFDEAVCLKVQLILFLEFRLKFQNI